MSTQHPAQRLGLAGLSLVMMAVGTAAMLLALGLDNAGLSERLGPILIGVLGDSVVPTGAYVAFWSNPSVVNRACGLITGVVGVWMAWWVASTILLAPL